MIVEYLRPKTLEEALGLLSRTEPRTIPLGGGTTLAKLVSEPVAVVDMQGLGMNAIRDENTSILIGATATLSEVDSFLNNSEFSEAVKIQAGKNLRNSGTMAGLICTATGRSPMLTLLLALDAKLNIEPGHEDVNLGDWLADSKRKSGKLITSIAIPKVAYRFHSIGRSPKDQPIVCVGVAKWSEKRMRIAIGGFGKSPTLVLDGTVSDDVIIAVRSALHDAKDEWASAEYRMEAGSIMAKRACDSLLGIES